MNLGYGHRALGETFVNSVVILRSQFGLIAFLHSRLRPLELPVEFFAGEDERRGAAVGTVVGVFG